LAAHVIKICDGNCVKVLKVFLQKEVFCDFIPPREAENSVCGGSNILSPIH